MGRRSGYRDRKGSLPQIDLHLLRLLHHPLPGSEHADTFPGRRPEICGRRAGRSQWSVLAAGARPAPGPTCAAGACQTYCNSPCQEFWGHARLQHLHPGPEDFRPGHGGVRGPTPGPHDFHGDWNYTITARSGSSAACTMRCGKRNGNGQGPSFDQKLVASLPRYDLLNELEMLQACVIHDISDFALIWIASSTHSATLSLMCSYTKVLVT